MEWQPLHKGPGVLFPALGLVFSALHLVRYPNGIEYHPVQVLLAAALFFM